MEIKTINKRGLNLLLIQSSLILNIRFGTHNYYGGMITRQRKIGDTTFLMHNESYNIYEQVSLNGCEYYFDPFCGGGITTGERQEGSFNSDKIKIKLSYFKENIITHKTTITV